MSQVHTSPDDALLLKDDLSIKTVIPIHFETFRLADDKQDEAEERLREIIQEKNDSSFKILHNGESITVKWRSSEAEFWGIFGACYTCLYAQPVPRY